MRNIADDRKYGHMNEETILPKLREMWMDEVNIQHTKDAFCPYDFQSESESTWEVKSRRVRKHAYDTTLLGVNKVRSVDTPQYFVFIFTDAQCYIKHDEQTFAGFLQADIMEYRQGCAPKSSPHYLIPLEQLIDF